VLGKENMDSMKVFLWPVLISIIGHVAMISISSMIDLHENIKPVEIFTVDLKEPEPFKQTPKEEKREIKKFTQDKDAKSIGAGGWREDTINLNGTDSKYPQYTVNMKRRLNSVWRKAKDKEEEGIVVLKISLNADGSIAEASLLSSSGTRALDDEAISVAKNAAPFGALPEDLSRLNVIVSFYFNVI
jgi:TonB family protein